MVRRSVKRPAVRVRWELEEYTLAIIARFSQKNNRRFAHNRQKVRIFRRFRCSMNFLQIFSKIGNFLLIPSCYFSKMQYTRKQEIIIRAETMWYRQFNNPWQSNAA